MSTDLSGQSIVKQYSLSKNLVRQNTVTGKDLREDLPINIVLPGELSTTMKDIGGYEEAKVEVIEYVNYINHKEQYKKLGARLPKGALLVGPPGTGKTLLARATAGAGNIPFISVSSASLLLGAEGPTKLRQIFQLAYSMAPCVLFFDEVDCIGRDRNAMRSKPEVLCITEEFLVQLDGFTQEGEKLMIVLASTNCKNELDDALIRPGRFDRIIQMPPPDLPSRMAILNVHLRPIKTSLDKTMLSKRFGILSSGMTGAQLSAMCNEAAMIAARDLNEEVRMEHFEQALDRVRSGIKKRKPLSKEEKTRAANHDAAHAIAGWYLEGTSPPTKLCILPDTDGCIRCSQCCEEMELPNVSREAAMNTISLVLAGCAAEEILHGEYQTSCSKDFEVAFKLALTLVTQCGYSSTLGKVSQKLSHYGWVNWEKQDILNIGPKGYDATHKELNQTMDHCFKKAKSILKKKSDELKKVSDLLVEKDLVTLDMLVDVLGPSPHIDMEKLSLADLDFLPAGMKDWNSSA